MVCFHSGSLAITSIARPSFSIALTESSAMPAPRMRLFAIVRSAMPASGSTAFVAPRPSQEPGPDMNESSVPATLAPTA